MSRNTSRNQANGSDQARQVGQAVDSSAIPREQLVAEAAYYKAEQRGFEPGNEMADWFEAESEIARMLGNASGTGDS